MSKIAIGERTTKSGESALLLTKPRPRNRKSLKPSTRCLFQSLNSKVKMTGMVKKVDYTSIKKYRHL